MATNGTRLEIVLHGLRWAANIVGEVLSNHGATMPKAARHKIHEGVTAIWEGERLIRDALQDLESR